MTETTKRIRWEPGEDGIIFGYSGTLKPWVFAVCPPSAPGDFWMISTSFPLGQPRYVGSEKEARAAAERRPIEFTASLGAVFPDVKRQDELADHIDRIIGWAKAGEHAGAGVDYYLMTREDVDQMRDHIIAYAFGYRATREGVTDPAAPAKEEGS